MKLKRLFVSVTILILSFFFLCCGQQKEKWQGTIEEVDGVIVVKNPMEPMYHDVVEISQTLSLGEKEGEDEEYIFPRVGTITVDDLGNIFVLIPRENQIRVFNSDGIFQYSFGRRGQGPGELERPSSFQINSKNEIFVDDIRRMIFFSKKGDVLSEIPVTKLPMGIRQMELDKKGNFWGIFGIREPRFSIELRKYNPNQEVLFTIATIIPPNPPFVFSLNQKDEIVWAEQSKYEINISDEEGRLLKRITRKYELVATTDEFEKDYVRRTGDKSDIPKEFNPIEDISIDDKGRIFVRTNESSEIDGSIFHDVYDIDGKYLTRIGLNAMLKKKIIWKEDILYTIEEDEDGYQYVKRYRVTWNI